MDELFVRLACSIVRVIYMRVWYMKEATTTKRSPIMSRCTGLQILSCSIGLIDCLHKDCVDRIQARTLQNNSLLFVSLINCDKHIN